MKRNYDLLVFDWDGTLVDSATTITQNIESVCKEMGLTLPERERIRYAIGLGFETALAFILPHLDKNHYQTFIQTYRAQDRLCNEALALFNGTADVIHSLHEQGYTLAVATGKNRGAFDKELDSSGLADFFCDSRCGSETLSKPDPTMLLELMERFNTNPERTLMIGDTTHDLQMAKNADVAVIAVSYGAHPKDELLKFAPLACLDHLSELTFWLNQNQE